MKNIDLIYREILFNAMEKGKFNFTQSELSKELGISLSIVNSAVRKLSSIGIVKVMQRGFKLLDIKKMIYYWASARNLEKDIIFSARIDMPIREIERMIPDVIFTGFTAYKNLFNDVPADYSEVYVYADEEELNLIKKRFSIKGNGNNVNPNLFVLKKDKAIGKYKKIPIAQLFVDIWNMKEWYAKEFLNELEKKI